MFVAEVCGTVARVCSLALCTLVRDNMHASRAWGHGKVLKLQSSQNIKTVKIQRSSRVCVATQRQRVHQHTQTPNSTRKAAIKCPRNVVVAVDHTVGSYNAVKWTLEHLYREGDVLHLLHVVPASSMLMPQPFGLASALPPEEGLQDCMAAHAQQFFETNFVQLAQRFGATCELDLVHGACNQAVSQTICKKVEDLSAAVVVLTEHKRGLLDGIFQVPVSKQVAESCSRPILIFHG